MKLPIQKNICTAKGSPFRSDEKPGRYTQNDRSLSFYSRPSPPLGISMKYPLRNGTGISFICTAKGSRTPLTRMRTWRPSR